jgi:multidrug efflux system membrane fusion protein
MDGKNTSSFNYGKIGEFIKKNKLVLVPAVSLLVIVIAAVFLHDIFRQDKKVTAIPGRPVKTAVVVQKTAPIYIEAFGTLSPLSSADVRTQVTGEIVAIHFEEGKDVKKDDILFNIDPSQYRANYDKAKAAVDSDLADLTLKKDTLERNRQLFEKELISQQDFEKYKTDVVSAEAKVQLDKSSLELAKIQLDYCSVKAPIDGVTGKRQVDLGNIVPANTGPALVNVKTIDPLYLDFTVPERDLPKVRRAMEKQKLKVELVPQGEDERYAGELDSMNNTVDQTTGTVSMRAIVKNEKRELWPGQFANVRLILGTSENALLVPFGAVQVGQTGQYVFVVTDDNKADLRPVVTRQRDGSDIVIESGVKAGEKVVTEGQLGLAPGVAVTDITQKTQAPASGNTGAPK